jgi:phage I-like protein
VREICGNLSQQGGSFRHDSDPPGQGSDEERSGTMDGQMRGPDPAKYVAIAEYERAVTELNTLRAERAREQAERQVDEAMRAGKLTPAQREWAVEYCAADPRGFEAFVAKQPAVLSAGAPRAIAGGREPHRGGRLTEAEVSICAQLGVSREEYLARRNGRSDFLALNRPGGDEE